MTCAWTASMISGRRRLIFFGALGASVDIVTNVPSAQVASSLQFSRMAQCTSVMANSFYIEGKQRAEKVNDLFARVAPRYDIINDLQSFGLHRAWKRRLVRMANPQPGERVLDVCCGTGDIAFAFAKSGTKVNALDFSEAMLAVAEEKLNRHPQSTARNPNFEQGDAMQLPFADST